MFCCTQRGHGSVAESHLSLRDAHGTHAASPLTSSISYYERNSEGEGKRRRTAFCVALRCWQRHFLAIQKWFAPVSSCSRQLDAPQSKSAEDENKAALGGTYSSQISFDPAFHRLQTPEPKHTIHMKVRSGGSQIRADPHSWARSRFRMQCLTSPSSKSHSCVLHCQYVESTDFGP